MANVLILLHMSLAIHICSESKQSRGGGSIRNKTLLVCQCEMQENLHATFTFIVANILEI